MILKYQGMLLHSITFKDKEVTASDMMDSSKRSVELLRFIATKYAKFNLAPFTDNDFIVYQNNELVNTDWWNKTFTYEEPCEYSIQQIKDHLDNGGNWENNDYRFTTIQEVEQGDYNVVRDVLGTYSGNQFWTKDKSVQVTVKEGIRGKCTACLIKATDGFILVH